MHDVDNLISSWTQGIDIDNLFADQTLEDDLFVFDEPAIGIDELVLDEPQKGTTHVSKDITTVDSTRGLRSEGSPNVLDYEEDEHSRLKTDKMKDLFDDMIDKVARFGIHTGFALWNENISDQLEAKEY